MAKLPIDEALNRFKDNEDRFNKFVNDDAGYTSSAGENVESVPAFLERIESEISAIGAIAITEANKVAAQAAQAAAESAEATAEAARDTAFTHATAAAVSRNEAYAAAAGLSAGGIIAKATKALLIADLAHADGTLGYVSNDSTPSNNGFYYKTGASGAGAWVQSTNPINNVRNTVSEVGVIMGGAKVVINRQAQTISLATSTYAGCSSKSYVLLPAQSVAISQASGALLTYYFDKTSGVIGIAEAGGAQIPDAAIIFAWDLNNKIYAVDRKFITYVDSTGKTDEATNAQQTGFLIGPSKTTINRQTGQVVVPTTVYGESALGLFSIPAQTVSFTANPGNVCAYYINTKTNVVGVSEATSIPGDCIVFAWDFANLIYGIDVRAITYVDSTGKTKEVLQEPTGFTESVNRLLVPNKMYFIEGKPLPLYKQSILADIDTNVLDLLKTALMPNAGAGGVAYASEEGRYRYFIEDIVLDPAKLGNTFAIGMKNNMKPNTRYIANVAKNVAPANAINGKTLRFVSIGDSLTESGMTNIISTRLAALGATPISQGSYAGAAYQTGGVKTEGRSNWTYRTFIGKDNVTGADIVVPAPDGTTTRGQNPFLKLATASDKSNYPTWCFRSTGSNDELSYQDDPDKTGNFYIFDFANYLAKHGVDLANPMPTPDFVTIALSTNDLWLNSGYETTWLQWCRTALEIMVRQIAAAAPNCKIGIIPTPGWGSTANGNSKNAAIAAWVEACLTDVQTLSATYNVSVIPVWAHFNRDWNFPTNFTALSSLNYSTKGDVADDVHFWGCNTTDKSLQGSQEYVDVVEAWVANQFKA